MAGKPTTWYERVVETAAQNLIDVVERSLASFGDTAPGLSKGSTHEQLLQWIYLRGDPAQWQQLIGSWAGFIGADAAVLFAVREGNRLEQALARAGGWDGSPESFPNAVGLGVQAVMAEEAADALAEAQRTAAKAQRLLDQPRMVVGPDVVPVDPVAAMIGRSGTPPPPLPLPMPGGASSGPMAA